MARIPLKGLSLDELERWLGKLDEPAYRVRQIREWIYEHYAVDFEEMSNLPLKLRARLAQMATLESARPIAGTRSLDHSVKYLFELNDGERVEAVLMHGRKHATLCISSQVGCPLDCVFCETGRMGLRRNLDQSEIVDQVVHLMRELPQDSPRPNIVFMGMGEPLLNLPNLVGALSILSDERGMGFGARRVTVSTAGFPKRIRQLADAPVKTRLALSLNASDDAMRRALMPARGSDSIATLLQACDDFAERTGQRVTLEYVLIAGINDRPEDAANLKQLTRGRNFTLNLIPYNPGAQDVAITWPNSRRSVELKRPSNEEIDRFISRLLPGVSNVTVRRSQGTDVGGGCGQLRTLLS